MITDENLKKMCDMIENSLESYVLEHKGQLFEDGKIIEGGMERRIKKQYESRLSSLIIAKGESTESLSENQQEYIKKRIKSTLDLSKNQYYS